MYPLLARLRRLGLLDTSWLCTKRTGQSQPRASKMSLPTSARTEQQQGPAEPATPVQVPPISTP
ncbi:MAG: hypothetical protein H0X18_11990 [Geodermatophilaceae bacterium]|nr:hypothetical protein [Geodermatophilaceae bacterium]